MTGPDRIRDLLGAALEGEPPGALDTAALVKLGRRRIRVRRMAAAGGVMAVAALVLVGATLVPSLLAGNHVQTASTPPTISTTAPATTTPETDTTTANAVTDQQLTNTITNTLGQFGITGMRVVHGSLTFSHHDTTATLSATLQDSKGTGTLLVTKQPTNPSVVPLCPPSTSCDIVNRAGQSVTIYTQVVINPSGVAIVAVVQRGVYRVTAISANFTANATAASRPAPPITADQLAVIAARLA